MEGDQTMVGDGNAVCVTSQIGPNPTTLSPRAICTADFDQFFPGPHSVCRQFPPTGERTLQNFQVFVTN
jgi:hypothetical protein